MSYYMPHSSHDSARFPHLAAQVVGTRGILTSDPTRIRTQRFDDVGSRPYHDKLHTSTSLKTVMMRQSTRCVSRLGWLFQVSKKDVPTISSSSRSKLHLLIYLRVRTSRHHAIFIMIAQYDASRGEEVC